MRRFFKHHSSLLTPLLITVVYFASVLLIFRRTYWENDNVGILDDIMLGHSVSFMSELFGKFLSFFYLHISGDFPWYGLALYLLLAVSFWVTLISVDTLCRDKFIKLGFLAFFLVFFTRFITNISYNSVSIFSGFAGLLAFLTYIRFTPKRRVGVLLLLGMLFTCCFTVRTSGIKAVAVFASLAVVFELIRHFRNTGPALAVFLIPLALVGGANALIATHEVDDPFTKYQSWNQIRGKFHGYPVSWINKENEMILKHNDWTRNDYNVLLQWLFFDENKFNTSTLENVFTYSQPLPQDQVASFRKLLSSTYAILATYAIYWIALLSLLVAAAIKRTRSAVFLQLANILILLCGGALMDTYLRFPPRIAVVLFGGTLITSVFFVFRNEVREPTRVQKRLARTMCYTFLALGVLDLFSVVDRIKDNQIGQNIFYDNQAILENLEAEILVLQPGGSRQRRYIDPLRTHHAIKSAVPVGWGIFSPRFYHYLNEHGMEHGYELLPRLIDNGRAYFVGTELAARNLERFVFDTYNLRGKYTDLRQLPCGIVIFKVITWHRPPPRNQK